MIKFIFTSVAILLLPFCTIAQDTVEVSLKTFIDRGLENSGQLRFEEQNIELAENQVTNARSQRFLPNFELNTQHGVVPGVISQRDDLSENEYYLDPELDNDWQDWAVFTRAEVTAVQPIFTWGALKNAVKAAESAAVAARERFEIEKEDYSLRLFDLYQSYVLTSEILRLLEEAENTMDKVENQVKEAQESDDTDIDESELYKFEIFQSEFAIRAAEVREEAAMTQRLWNYVLEADENTVYVPDSDFLDPTSQTLRELDYYRSNARSNRSELEAIEAGINAAEYGMNAQKQRNYPSLFLGLTGSYANTPNRPRQSNPFIINNSNYASGSFGLGIRQNLDFLGIKAQVERGEIQYKQAKFLKDAAVDGIELEINEAFKEASLSKLKVNKTDEALVTGKEWLRQEQLDYDFGIGDTKDLIDAMQKELELRVQLKREVFELNQNMADLYRKAGLPVTEITKNN